MDHRKPVEYKTFPTVSLSTITRIPASPQSYYTSLHVTVHLEFQFYYVKCLTQWRLVGGTIGGAHYNVWNGIKERSQTCGFHVWYPSINSIPAITTSPSSYSSSLQPPLFPSSLPGWVCICPIFRSRSYHVLLLFIYIYKSSISVFTGLENEVVGEWSRQV